MSTPVRKRKLHQGASRIQARAWARAWKVAGIRLDRLRRRRLEKLTSYDVQHAMRTLDGAFKALRRRRHSRTTSGLVQLQAWLRRLGR